MTDLGKLIISYFNCFVSDQFLKGEKMGNKNGSITQDIVKKPKGYFFFDRSFGKWIVYRFSTSLIWYFLFVRVSNKPFIFGDLFDEQILIIPFFVWFILMAIFGRWGRLMIYPLYLISFPIVVIYIIIKSIIKIFS